VNEISRYLLPTEVPVVMVRRHWASLARAALIFLGCVASAVFVIAFLPASQFFAIVGILGLFGAAGWFGWALGDWYVERFVITDKRVLLITGLVTRRVAIMPLNRVTDLTYERSIVGRLLGYGVFVMESAGQHQGLSRVDYLPTPEKLYHDVSALLFGPRSTASYGRVDLPPAGHAPSSAADQVTSPLPPLWPPL
jgi:uncharacterized membrane protein YdbT with pleckstrin-like domain